MTHRLDEPGAPLLCASGVPGLVVTDVDSTLISQEVIEELAGAAGTRERVAEITSRAMNGELDFAESLRERVATLAGVPESVFGDVLSAITPTKGARELIDAVHRAGGRFGIVSGGFEEVVAPLAASLDIDFYAANRLEVVGGVLTGRVLGRIVTSHVKVDCLRSWASSLGVPLERTVAIGDGANDVPMMHEAGVGIAFCAKPAVREQVSVQLNTPDLSLAIAPLGLAEPNASGLARVCQADHVPVPPVAPGARVLEDLRGVDLTVDLGRGLVDIPPRLGIDDGALQVGPPVPAERGRRCLGDEEPLVLPRGDGQKIKLRSSVQDGSNQRQRIQRNARFLEDLTHRSTTGVLPLLDAAPNREPPESLRLVLVVALRQQDASLIVKQEDAGGLPVGVAVRVQWPVECAHASRVARRRRKPHTRSAALTTKTGISMVP